MVGYGVTTAIAIQSVTKYLEDSAALAARAEMEKLIISSLSQQNTQTLSKNNGTNKH